MRNTQIRRFFFSLGGFISQEYYCFISQNKFHFLKSQKHYICLLKFFKSYILTIGKLLTISRDWERVCENPYRYFTHREKKNFRIYSAALSFSLGVRLTLRSRKWATREGKCTTQNSPSHQRFFSPCAGVRGWGVWRWLSAGLRYAQSSTVLHCLAATFTSHLAGKITAAPSVNSSALIALADPYQVTNPSSLWHRRSHFGSLTNTCSLFPTLCPPCEDQVEFPMGSSRAIPKVLEFAPSPLLCGSPLINNMTPFLRGLWDSWGNPSTSLLKIISLFLASQHLGF